MTSRHSIPKFNAERLVNKQGAPGTVPPTADQRLKRGLLWAALSCTKAACPAVRFHPHWRPEESPRG